MAHRVALRVETDLGDIWLYVARESASTLWALIVSPADDLWQRSK
jgi:hypothetical protein